MGVNDIRVGDVVVIRKNTKQWKVVELIPNSAYVMAVLSQGEGKPERTEETTHLRKVGTA